MKVLVKVLATIVLVLLGGLLAAAPSAALTVNEDESVSTGAVSSRAVAQKRARTRVRVRPIYPRHPVTTFYPPSYDIRYPGPNARRECVARYVEEHRPSGTVVTPRMRCRWVRG